MLYDADQCMHMHGIAIALQVVPYSIQNACAILPPLQVVDWMLAVLGDKGLADLWKLSLIQVRSHLSVK